MLGTIVFGIAIVVLLYMGHKGESTLGVVSGMMLCAYPHLFADALMLDFLSQTILTLVGALIVMLMAWGMGGK